MADRGEEGRCAGGRKWSRMADGLQMQEMALKWQAVRNLNLNMKAMESNRGFHTIGYCGKPLSLQWEGQIRGGKTVGKNTHRRPF